MEENKKKFIELIENNDFRGSSHRDDIACDTDSLPRKRAGNSVEYMHAEGSPKTKTLGWHSQALLDRLYFNLDSGEVTFMTVSLGLASLS